MFIFGFFYCQNLISYIFTGIGFIVSIYTLNEVKTVEKAIDSEKKKELLEKSKDRINKLLDYCIDNKCKIISNNGDNDGDENNIILSIEKEIEIIIQNCSEIENYGLISNLKCKLENFKIEEISKNLKELKEILREIRDKIDKNIKERNWVI
jgi:hypothetical protein